MGQTDSGGNGFPLQRRPPLQAKRVIGDNGTPVDSLDTINSRFESRNAKGMELSLLVGNKQLC